jgi:Protein of unknown function (DUF2971)
MTIRLFKYRTVNEYTRQIICNGELYFARPDQFNDPFDCRLDILDGLDREALRAEASSASQGLAIDTARVIIQSGTHEPYDRLSVREAIKLRFVNAYEDELGKYCDLPNSISSIRAAVGKIGIFSMSKLSDDILMFSHYANNHKGIVLEFEVEEGQEPFQEVESVRYATTMAPVTASNALDLILIKSWQWTYEQEVRALKPVAGIHKFQPNTLKSIVFGAEMDPKDKVLVLNWIKDSGKQLNILQAVKDNRAFKLNLCPLAQAGLV